MSDDDGGQSASHSSLPESRGSSFDAANSSDEEDQGPTELVLTFERRGEGWGEELLPRAQFKRLPISRKEQEPPRSSASSSAATSTSTAAAATTSRASPSSRSSSSSASSPSSRRADAAAAQLELLLRDPAVAGLSCDEAAAVVSAATSWRVTPAGRALRDRASVDRASRRAEAVVAYLRDECGLQAGRDGVGAALRAAPRALLCRPARHDRWDRRFVQLAAFAARHGHPDVPEDDGDAVNAVSPRAAAALQQQQGQGQGQQQAVAPPGPEGGGDADGADASPPLRAAAASSSPVSAGLGAWAARQRAAWQAGALDAERAAALAGLGFDFGDGEFSFFVSLFFE